MKFISLTKGKKAIVDDEDHASVSQHKWCANCNRSGTWYAMRFSYSEGKRTTVMLHRFLMNPPEGFVVDHVNDDGLDNRRQNLRVCTIAQNAWKMRSRRNKSSRYKGVSWDKEKKLWRATIQKNHAIIRIGRYKTEDDAARAYDTRALDLYGEFARCNLRPTPKSDA